MTTLIKIPNENKNNWSEMKIWWPNSFAKIWNKDIRWEDEMLDRILEAVSKKLWGFRNRFKNKSQNRIRSQEDKLSAPKLLEGYPNPRDNYANALQHLKTRSVREDNLIEMYKYIRKCVFLHWTLHAINIKEIFSCIFCDNL